ncbi:hypothetical protein CAAN1_25S00540 [[Candida] anglica]|uniref:Uncharacterized protein n=1 Tax=[Candida] anglica TaxID=148631 RepID=A0ABP0EDW5_9ASCO
MMIQNVARRYAFQRMSVRHSSLWSKAKDLNAKVDKLGDEKNVAAQKTLKYLRKAGIGSMVVMLLSLGYAGSFVE